MKCSECSACHKVTYNRRTRHGTAQIEKYECWGVREPFEIMDINKECTEYPEKREAKAERKCKLPKITDDYVILGNEKYGIKITSNDITFIQDGKTKTLEEMIRNIHIDRYCSCCGREFEGGGKNT